MGPTYNPLNDRHHSPSPLSSKIMDLLHNFKLWHFVALAVVVSEILTALMSLILRGRDLPAGLPAAAYSPSLYWEVVYDKGALYFDALRLRSIGTATLTVSGPADYEGDTGITDKPFTVSMSCPAREAICCNCSSISFGATLRPSLSATAKR